MNDPSASLPVIQMFLSWTLLGVLLAWMLFFAFLALRPQKVEGREPAELPTPSGAFSAITPRTPFRRPVTPVEVATSVSATTSTAAEPLGEVGEVGAAPVA